MDSRGRTQVRAALWIGITMDPKLLEARGGIEPPMEVLQTSALPLGDRASVRWRCARDF